MGLITEKWGGTAVIAAQAPVTSFIAALRPVTVNPVIGAGVPAAQALIICLIAALHTVTELPVIGAGVVTHHTGIGGFITLRTVTELPVVWAGKR